MQSQCGCWTGQGGSCCSCPAKGCLLLACRPRTQQKGVTRGIKLRASALHHSKTFIEPVPSSCSPTPPAINLAVRNWELDAPLPSCKLPKKRPTPFPVPLHAAVPDSTSHCCSCSCLPRCKARKRLALYAGLSLNLKATTPARPHLITLCSVFDHSTAACE